VISLKAAHGDFHYSLQVMRPIWLPPTSVKHSAPSGPTAMPKGALTKGRAYSVIAPDGAIRPILPLTIFWVNQSAPSGPPFGGASGSLDRRSGREVQWTEKRTHEVIELMIPVQEKAPRKAGPRDWKRYYLGE
jgi:hypothetical protein